MSKISDTLVVTAAFRVGSVLVTTRFASCLGFVRVESMLLLTLCIVTLNHFFKTKRMRRSLSLSHIYFWCIKWNCLFVYTRLWNGTLKDCLHVPFQCQCPSKSPLKFIIVSIVMNHLTDRLGLEPILSISVNLMVAVMEMGMETVCVNEP